MDVLKDIEALGVANRLKANQCAAKAEGLRRQIASLPEHYSSDLVPGEAKRLEADATKWERDATRYRRQASFNEQSLVLMDPDNLNDAEGPMSKGWYLEAQRRGLIRFTDEGTPNPEDYA